MRKLTIALMTIAAVALLVSPANAATIDYTWTGGAGSGSDWADTGNWVGGVVPDGGGDKMNALGDANDLATFDSETAVGGYITPTAFDMVKPYGGGAPSISILNGTLNWGRSANQALGSKFTVGDGDLGTMATLNLNNTIYLNHGGSSSKSYVVNADGTLALGADVQRWSSGGTTVARLIGGTMNISGAVNGDLTNVAGNYVNFEDYGSSFTASYGGQLTDFATVSGQLGDSFKLDSALTGGELSLTDNGTSFTINAIPEPASLSLLMLVGGACFIIRRRFRR